MEPYLGEIRLFSWNWAPTGWHICDGTLMPIQGNQALFSLFNTRYGGDGKSTFGLPDLRGRVAVHMQSSVAPIIEPGAMGGTELVVLTADQIPPHNHSLNISVAPGTKRVPAANVFAAAPAGTYLYGPLNEQTLVTLSPNALQPNNGKTPAGHPNLQPYLVLNYCVALVGVYPPRN